MRTVFQGNASSSDIWNIGFWWQKPAPSDGTIDYNALAADVLAKFKSDFWSATTSPWTTNLSSDCTLTTAKVYGYDGGLLTGEGVATSSPVGGTQTITSPRFTACVATLQTASFGRSHRGRVYLPYTNGCNTTGQLSLVQAYADNLKAFLVRNTFAGLPAAPIIESLVVSRTHGTVDPITKVRMDSLPDTQRGRISKAVPANTYTSVVRTG